jgi:hypothetical protein
MVAAVTPAVLLRSHAGADGLGLMRLLRLLRNIGQSRDPRSKLMRGRPNQPFNVQKLQLLRNLKLLLLLFLLLEKSFVAIAAEVVAARSQKIPPPYSVPRPYLDCHNRASVSMRRLTTTWPHQSRVGLHATLNPESRGK